MMSDTDYRSVLNCTVPETDREQGQAKIFFACHPDDFEDCFLEIINDIRQIRDVPIYYCRPDQEISREELENELLFMNLVVVPVTSVLLNDWEPAETNGIGFALSNNISVLPIVTDDDAVRENTGAYRKHFENRQFILKHDEDPTALKYEKKLENHLDLFLFDEETVRRVRSAFDAFIFLSYRKKDRKIANDLIRLIHSDPELEKVAVWYDEYLTLGEDFEKTIGDAIGQCTMSTLLVTPSILEPGNYILENEYRMMCSQGKKPLPVEMRMTDAEKLQQLYGIRETVKTDRREDFFSRLEESLKNTGFSRTQGDPLHDYLIGLAYLKGINTQTDIDLSHRLIESAANSGLTEAMPVLVNILYDHKKSYVEAEEWEKRYIEALKPSSEADPEGEENRRYVKELFRLFEVQSHYSTNRELLRSILEMTSALRSEWAMEDFVTVSCLCAQYSLQEKRMPYYEQALEKMGILCEKHPGPDHDIQMIKVLRQIASHHETYGHPKQEEQCRRQMAEYAGHMHEAYPSYESEIQYVECLRGYADCLFEHGDHKEAKLQYEKAEAIADVLIETAENTRNLSAAHPVYAGLGSCHEEGKDLHNAITNLKKALDILYVLRDRKKTYPYRYFNDYAGRLEGCYRKLGRYQEQKKYFLLKQDYSDSFGDYGDYSGEDYIRFSGIAFSSKDFATAVDCWDKGLDRAFRSAAARDSLEQMAEHIETAKSILKKAQELPSRYRPEAVDIVQRRLYQMEDQLARWKQWMAEGDEDFRRPD